MRVNRNGHTAEEVMFLLFAYDSKLPIPRGDETFVFLFVRSSFLDEHSRESLDDNYVFAHRLEEFTQPSHFEVALNHSSG